MIAEFIAKYYGDPIVQNWIKNDKTLIVLKHPGYHKHLRDGPRHTIFVDRDISQYQSTAECCGPIKRDKAREMFGDLDLL